MRGTIIGIRYFMVCFYNGFALYLASVGILFYHTELYMELGVTFLLFPYFKNSGNKGEGRAISNARLVAVGHGSLLYLVHS